MLNANYCGILWISFLGELQRFVEISTDSASPTFRGQSKFLLSFPQTAFPLSLYQRGVGPSLSQAVFSTESESRTFCVNHVPKCLSREYGGVPLQFLLMVLSWCLPRLYSQHPDHDVSVQWGQQGQKFNADFAFEMESESDEDGEDDEFFDASLSLVTSPKSASNPKNTSTWGKSPGNSEIGAWLKGLEKCSQNHFLGIKSQTYSPQSLTKAIFGYLANISMIQLLKLLHDITAETGLQILSFNDALTVLMKSEQISFATSKESSVVLQQLQQQKDDSKSFGLKSIKTAFCKTHDLLFHTSRQRFFDNDRDFVAQCLPTFLTETEMISIPREVRLYPIDSRASDYFNKLETLIARACSILQCVPDCPTLASSILSFDVEKHIRCDCTVGTACSHCLNKAPFSRESSSTIESNTERNRLYYLFDATTSTFVVVSPETVLSDEPTVRFDFF